MSDVDVDLTLVEDGECGTRNHPHRRTSASEFVIVASHETVLCSSCGKVHEAQELEISNVPMGHGKRVTLQCPETEETVAAEAGSSRYKDDSDLQKQTV